MARWITIPSILKIDKYDFSIYFFSDKSTHTPWSIFSQSLLPWQLCNIWLWLGLSFDHHENNSKEKYWIPCSSNLCAFFTFCYTWWERETEIKKWRNNFFWKMKWMVESLIISTRSNQFPQKYQFLIKKVFSRVLRDYKPRYVGPLVGRLVPFWAA